MKQEERYIKKQKELYIKNLYDECIFWANHFKQCKKESSYNYWISEADRYMAKLKLLNTQTPTP